MRSVAIKSRRDPSGCRRLEYEVGWRGQVFTSPVLALDTETTCSDDPATVPGLVLVSVSDGSRHVVLPASQAAAFLRAHAQRHLVFHNVAFDFWVLHEHCRQTGASDACTLLWQLAQTDRLHDSMLLDMLVRLAKTGEEPNPRDLAVIADEYAGLQLDKADPYRKRYGQIRGRDLSTVDPGFLDYAIKDAFATLAAYASMDKQAEGVMATHASLFDAAFAKQFGRLTEAIQVKAAIALADISRRGIGVDVGHLQQLQRDLARQQEADIEAIEQGLRNDPCLREHPDFQEDGLFRRDASGQLERNPGGTPRVYKRKLQLLLKRAADEIGLTHPPRAPNGREISTSVDAWAQFLDQHPFLKAWGELSKWAKRIQFANTYKQSRVHPRYQVLAKTGRTRCSRPNIQQLPREGGVREAFVPSEGHRFVSIDYAFIELRTLAAVLEARYGHSRLAQVIRDGVDPHVHTAAMILGMSVEQFEALQRSDAETFRDHRQRAKAINFGVPGGLAAPSLAAYARATYGIEMSVQDAHDLRHRLITQVYPELERYLADDGMAVLAQNLRIDEQTLWQALDFAGNRSPSITSAVRNVVKGRTRKADGSPYNERWYANVWDTLIRLNRNPDLTGLLQARKGSPALHDRLFSGVVATPTGRLRAGATFCQARNTPFQGLAADGAKLALFELVRAGYRIVAFIHDEILVELPIGADEHAEAQKIRQIMCDAMRRVTGKIPIACGEPVFMDRWSKEGGSAARECLPVR